jgi:hypothetical protein
LCAALSVGEAAKNFKIVRIGSTDAAGVSVRVLHKDTGAVWVFECRVERRGV